MRWYWWDWPLFSRHTGARRILDSVPSAWRTWPGLRRYYWQADEITQAREKYARLFEDR